METQYSIIRFSLRRIHAMAGIATGIYCMETEAQLFINRIFTAGQNAPQIDIHASIHLLMPEQGCGKDIPARISQQVASDLFCFHIAQQATSRREITQHGCSEHTLCRLRIVRYRQARRRIPGFIFFDIDIYEFGKLCHDFHLVETDYLPVAFRRYDSILGDTVGLPPFIIFIRAQHQRRIREVEHALLAHLK